MRACVVGAGVAGAVLGWRLAAAEPRAEVDLVLGGRCRADATAASGGTVRAYEVHPTLRRLATESLAELLASPVLRRWARYRRVELVYRPAAGLAAADLAEIDSVLPGSVSRASAGELAALGWSDLPPDAVAVREPDAGYTAPSRLRDAVLADGAARARVRLRAATLDGLTPRPGGTVECLVAGSRREYDVVVIAAGPWTGSLLARLGLPAPDYRTKSIQYAVHRVTGWRPGQFVDEVIGLYGRRAGVDGLLLGVPTDQWGVDPERPPVTPALHETAVALARRRFPSLKLGPTLRTVGAADCYGPTPTLSLQRVGGAGHRLYTFTGGAGGAAKTVLAASRHAVTQLTGSGEPGSGRFALAGSGEPSAPTTVGPREGQS